VHEDSLFVGGHRVGIPSGEWSPPRVYGLMDRRRVAAGVLRHVLGRDRVLDLGGRPWDVSGDLRQHGLRAAVAHLGGRGSGLTPAGDDCVAGIFLVTSLLSSAGAATWSASALVELTSGYGSHEISQAFLRAAARGESIEPLHTLLASCVREDRRAAVQTVRLLDEIGHTSGRDMAYGMLVGLELAECVLVNTASQSAR